MRADRRHHIDAEAERAAERGKALRRAGAALAKGEIVPDHDMARAEPLGHDLGGEGLGAQRGQRLVEGNDEGLIEAESLQQLELQGQRRQPEERRVRREELARMRLEHHRAGTAAFLLWRCLIAALSTSWWPRWTPSKLPMASAAPLSCAGTSRQTADNVHHGKPSISLYWRGARRSTIITASPSSTVLPLTAQSQASVARPFSAIEAGDLQRGDHLVADIDRAP